MSSYKTELNFVEFDQQGEPHPMGDLEDPVKRRLLPVLYDGDRWLGPLWKRDERGDLKAIDGAELTRMHFYAYKKSYPEEVTVKRLKAEGQESMYYYTEQGSHNPVPVLEDGTSLFDIPFK